MKEMKKSDIGTKLLKLGPFIILNKTIFIKKIFNLNNLFLNF